MNRFKKFVKFAVDTMLQRRNMTFYVIFSILYTPFKFWKTLTLFRMDFFGTVHGWRRGAKSPPLLPKICLTYPTIMKLGTVIPYLKTIQKLYESRDKHLEFC